MNYLSIITFLLPIPQRLLVLLKLPLLLLLLLLFHTILLWPSHLQRILQLLLDTIKILALVILLFGVILLLEILVVVVIVTEKLKNLKRKGKHGVLSSLIIFVSEEKKKH